MGLRLVLQPRPLCPALYAISVRRLGTLPAASFRFHFTMDTLAVRLTLPTTKRVVDFHHQAIAHGGRTTQNKRPTRFGRSFGVLSRKMYLDFCFDLVLYTLSVHTVQWEGEALDRFLPYSPY